jgi:hypothetical protein
MFMPKARAGVSDKKQNFIISNAQVIGNCTCLYLGRLFYGGDLWKIKFVANAKLKNL